VRQVAWLHATPERAPNGPERQSRIEEMKARGETPLLPNNPAPYLTDWLFDVGPINGDALVGYGDLAAWQQIAGIELLPWEAKLIRRLSAEYSNERYRARKADYPAPYSGALDDIVANRAAVDAKVRSAFLNLKKKT